jgi:hypothetical protein
VERSPNTTPWTPTAAASALRLRASFRACNTISWPCSISSRVAIRPRPSDDPVMKTRAKSRTSSLAPTPSPPNGPTNVYVSRHVLGEFKAQRDIEQVVHSRSWGSLGHIGNRSTPCQHHRFHISAGDVARRRRLFAAHAYSAHGRAVMRPTRQRYDRLRRGLPRERPRLRPSPSSLAIAERCSE